MTFQLFGRWANFGPVQTVVRLSRFVQNQPLPGLDRKILSNRFAQICENWGQAPPFFSVAARPPGEGLATVGVETEIEALPPSERGLPGLRLRALAPRKSRRMARALRPLSRSAEAMVSTLPASGRPGACSA